MAYRISAFYYPRYNSVIGLMLKTICNNLNSHPEIILQPAPEMWSCSELHPTVSKFSFVVGSTAGSECDCDACHDDDVFDEK